MVENRLETHYEILQVLSQEPLAQKFLARTRQSPDPRTCWIYEFSLHEDNPEVLDYARQLFEYEAERFAQLSTHPTIPTLRDAFEDNRKFYIVQDWLPGETLTDLLASTPPSPRQWLVEMVRSVASTLAFVHDHNTLHCNLSPRNLFWHEASQTWLLLNFGAFYQLGLLGIDPTGDVQLLGRLGVPGYIPEDEQAPLNPQYDLYSLGMITVEALIGDRPLGPQIWRQKLELPISPDFADCLDCLLMGKCKTATDVVNDLKNTTLSPSQSALGRPTANFTFSDTVSFSDLATDELAPDTLLANRYRLLRPLSHGGFGQTYIAIDEQFPGQPKCVVKKLKPQHDSPKVHKIARRMFDQEAEVLSRLGQHDQIPQLMAHFEENEEFYLVEEFVDGHDLESELPLKHKLSEARVVKLLTEIFEVLSFVHEQKVIHRDLKPANIRRRKADNKLVLIDFGAVKQLSEVVIEQGQTKLTVSIGTAGFAPSEQTQGRPRLSSDVYAIGMIGIQALTGVDPEDLPEDPKTGEVIWQQAAKVTPALAEVISRMVRYDFRQRYPSAREALRALQQVYLPSEALTEVVPSKPWWQRYRVPLAIAGGLVLMGGIGGLGYRSGWFDPSPQQLLKRITASTVQVQHADGSGFSTGFVIPGANFKCKILTTGDAIAAGQEITIGAEGATKAVEDVQTFEGLNVAQLTVASELAKCPYPALPLGDSTTVVQGDMAYLGGFVRPEGTDVTEQDIIPTTVEQVLDIPITGGYRLAYDTGEQQSLGGSVLLNAKGQVVGIHGRVREETLNTKSQGLAWAIPLRSYLIASQPSANDPNNAEQVRDQADQFFAAQRYSDALAAYERLITLRPERPEPWYGKGSSLYSLGRYEEAIAAYDEALKFREENALIWYSRGNAQFLLKQYPEALESYTRALQYKPDYFTALNNLGLAQQAMEQYDEALATYDEVIELRPEYHSAWHNKGSVLFVQGDLEGAIAAYDQAIELRPSYSNAWYNRAIVYGQQNNIPKSLESLQRAIELQKAWAKAASEDANFATIRNNSGFKALVGL